MFKTPEWMDDAISTIEKGIIAAETSRVAYIKRGKKATLSQYLEVLDSVTRFNTMNGGPSYTTYQGLAGISMKARMELRKMNRRLKKNHNIDTTELIEYRDIKAEVKRGQFEALKKKALTLLAKSHPHRDMSGPDAEQSIASWRAYTLHRILGDYYKKPLDAPLPTAEELVSIVDTIQIDTFNKDYAAYRKAMIEFSDTHYKKYKSKGNNASYGDYQKLRNAPSSNYGVQLSPVGMYIVPALAKAELGTLGLDICERLDVEGRFVPNKLERESQAQYDTICTELSATVGRGKMGRDKALAERQASRLIELYNTRSLVDVSALTLEQAMHDYEQLVNTSEGM